MSAYPSTTNRNGSTLPYPSAPSFEVNPNGDQQNGSMGGATASSSANATNQSQTAKPGTNVFTDVLNHVTAFNAAMGGGKGGAPWQGVKPPMPFGGSPFDPTKMTPGNPNPSGKPTPQPVGAPISPAGGANTGVAGTPVAFDQSAELGGRPDAPPQTIPPVGYAPPVQLPPQDPSQKGAPPPVAPMPPQNGAVPPVGYAPMPAPPAQPPPGQKATPPPAYDPNAARNTTPPPAPAYPPPQYAQQPDQQTIGQQSTQLSVQSQSAGGDPNGPIIKDPNGDPTQPTGGTPTPPGGGLPPLKPGTPEDGQPSGPGGGRGGRPTQPVTPGTDPIHYDPSGKPWSYDNPPPKPPNTEDPTVAANWYKQFNFLDPTLQNITPADVQAFRTSGYTPPADLLAKTPFNSAFLAWWQNGKPTPAQTPPPPANNFPGNVWTPDQAKGGVVPQGPVNPSDPNYARITGAQNNNTDPGNVQATPPAPGTPPATPPVRDQNSAGGQSAPGTPSAPPPATPPPTPPPATPPPATPPPAAPPPATPPPATPPPDAPPGTPPANTPADEIQRMIDLFNQNKGPDQPGIESQLNPMFARQRQQLSDQMRADAAATGAINSGGFGQNLGNAQAALAGQQGAALAGQMGEEYLAKLQQNTQLTQLATQAGMQKYLSDINTDLEKYKVVTNADLQRYLADQSNALQKYGIDTNDVLQRYLGKLGIDKANIDANATISAAQFHAAAAEAAANAASNASMINAQLQYQLGTAGLGVDREKNIGNFILGLLGLGQGGMNNLGDIFKDFPFGKTIFG